MGKENEWDFFISHASEDKDEIARPLAELLEALGFKVWYDEFALKLGDSLNQSINNGLAASKYGVLILSHNFFAKHWPKRELDGLVAIETASDESRILPIWHNLTHQEIATYSPALADKIAITSSKGLEATIELPDHFPRPAHDILLPNNVLAAFKQLNEFKEREIDVEELDKLYQTLWVHKITTRQRIHQLVSSDKILSTLRNIYHDELGRGIDPIDVANFGGYFINMQVTQEGIDFVRQTLRQTEEYRNKHPDANIPPVFTVHLYRIVNGKDLMSILAESHALHFDNDEPENAHDMEILSAFRENVRDWADEADFGGDPVRASFMFAKEIAALESNSFFVYGAIKKRKYNLDTKTAELSVAFVVVTRRNLPRLTLLQPPDL